MAGATPRHRAARLRGIKVPACVPKAVLKSDAFLALGLAHRKVLVALVRENAAHGGARNGRLALTYDQLVARCCISRKSVAPALRVLERVGLVRRTGRDPQRAGGRFPPTSYRVTFFPAPAVGLGVTYEWANYFLPGRAKAPVHPVPDVVGSDPSVTPDNASVSGLSREGETTLCNVVVASRPASPLRRGMTVAGAKRLIAGALENGSPGGVAMTMNLSAVIGLRASEGQALHEALLIYRRARHFLDARGCPDELVLAALERTARQGWHVHLILQCVRSLRRDAMEAALEGLRRRHGLLPRHAFHRDGWFQGHVPSDAGMLGATDYRLKGAVTGPEEAGIRREHGLLPIQGTAIRLSAGCWHAG